ncbi:LysM peptidoglycan-binding domain-containing protein [Micromonospora sp. HM5-17]|uniref:LysM peptidoglycan-binding domain-containing protein n=1 Tax=Micromonospora sp. HM5-17 TaxID=2487710 RepID=UPI000F47CA82|nr:LysM peptidoglycan-binding domain-containing protein [Micromonospora sp. HM5-17]ROT33813.1 LysM peptidoglycan-binding domain-containing protein [Micromonospora sp. HM5-17]
MPGSRTAHRAGRLAAGLGALIILVGLLAGAPIALLTFAGNPLPDHVPTLGELGTVLTSRDDGQLFLRALALVGWAGWATFALSVLVEVPARILRRPAIRLPGLGRQQRWAAALVGSVALALVASPAAAVTATAAGPAVTTSAPPSTGPAATPASTATTPVSPGVTPSGPAPHWLAPRPSGPAPHWLAAPATPAERSGRPEPVYRVEKGDYLGHIADRYLGDFDRYPELARLNKIRNPDRIHPGQMLRLPESAEDRGVREHATGLVATPPAPGGPEEDSRRRSQPNPDQPEQKGGESRTDGVRPDVTPPAKGSGPGQWQPSAPAHAPSAAPTPGPHSGTGGDDRTTYVAGAPAEDATDEVNRPLAVSAVLAVAGMVGAQLGTVFGLRGRSARRPTATSGRHRLRD